MFLIDVPIDVEVPSNAFFYLLFLQQPTFEDGEIELARPEMLSQDALVDNKHSLAVSLSLGNTLINLNKIKCPQCRKVSLGSSSILSQD